jgi:hypothetical protein
VYSEFIPPLDREVQTELFFPDSQLIDAGIQVTAKARVLRTEPATHDRTESGFAVVTRKLTLQRRKSAGIGQGLT